jgi:hypothetical protein
MAGFEYSGQADMHWHGLFAYCDAGGCGWGPTVSPLYPNDTLDVKISSTDHGKTWTFDMITSSAVAGNWSHVLTVKDKNGIYLPYASVVFSSQVANCNQLSDFGSLEQDRIEIKLADGSKVSSVQWDDTITSSDATCASAISIDSKTDPFHIVDTAVTPVK